MEDNLQKMIGVTVIFDAREYIVTGRQAVQKKPSGKTKVLWEIQPLSVYKTSPNNLNFNKWVPRNVLMLIEDKRAPIETMPK